MDAHPGIGILGPKVLNSDLSLQHSCRKLPTCRDAFFRALKLDTSFPNSRLFAKHQMMHWDYSDTREVDILSGCFWMVRRTALEQVGLLDTRFFIYGEDMDLCRRFRAEGWQVVFYPGAKIVHHGGASSANAPARFWVEMQRANLQYWLKHNGRGSAVVYYFCLILHNLIRVAAFGGQRLAGFGDQESVRRKFERSWRGLIWLLSTSELPRLIRGKL